MKMVRPVIERAYAERLVYLYTPEGKQPDNPQNLIAMRG